MSSLLSHADRRGSFAVSAFLALMVIVAAGAVVLYFRYYQEEDKTSHLITHTVARDSFRHIVLEQGEVESSENVEVICNVKSRNRDGTAILWVVDEGTWVKKGDKLVELDASALDQEIKQQRIVVNSANAQKIAAFSDLEIAKVEKEEYLELEVKTFSYQEMDLQLSLAQHLLTLLIFC